MGYKELGNAIVEQACCDFISSQMKLMGIKKKVMDDGTIVYTKRVHKYTDESIVKYKRRILDCVSFFRSEWYSQLCPEVPGDEAIENLNKLVQEIVKEFEKQELERIMNQKDIGRKKKEPSEAKPKKVKKRGRPKKEVQK